MKKPHTTKNGVNGVERQFPVVNRPVLSAVHEEIARQGCLMTHSDSEEIRPEQIADGRFLGIKAADGRVRMTWEPRPSIEQMAVSWPAMASRSLEKTRWINRLNADHINELDVYAGPPVRHMTVEAAFTSEHNAAGLLPPDCLGRKDSDDRPCKSNAFATYGASIPRDAN